MRIHDDVLDDIYRLAKEQADLDQHEAHVVELLEPYLQLRPDHGRAWLMHGECLLLIGRIDEAMEAMLKALELAPNNKKSHISGRIGFLYSQHIEKEEAEKWYKSAVEEYSCTEGWVLLLRGVNLIDLSRYEEALHCFKKSLGFDDVDESEIYLNIGLVFRAMRKYDESIQAFRNALELDNNYEEAKMCLAGLSDIKTTLERARSG